MVDLRKIALLFCSIAGRSLADWPDDPLSDNSPRCDCYVTEGSSSAFFTYHRFFDFRNLDDPHGLYDGEPAVVANEHDQGHETRQQGFLASTEFSKDWAISRWGKGPEPDHPIKFRYSPENVYVQRNDDDPSITHLTLRTHRNPDFSSSGEMENLQQNVFYGSIRFRARVHGASGAVAGMFTYLNDTCESDIEILTRDPTDHIWYTNQPNVGPDGYTIKAAGTEATLPDGIAWTDWNIHRLDWTPHISAWYANDIFVADNTYGIPRFPSSLTLNMWSDGGDWSGNMTVGSMAYLDIQWIDMVFNTSGPVTGYEERRGLEAGSDGCGTVCAVDGVRRPGFPEVVHSASASVAHLLGSGWSSFLTWSIPFLLAVLEIQANF